MLIYRYKNMYIPERMRTSIDMYVKEGTIPGDFLQAIICNNLKDAFLLADYENFENIGAYASYFYNKVPAVAWGSRDRMIAWAEHHGLSEFERR